VEAFPLNAGGGSLGAEIERVCTENELVISTWSPVHLRAKLRELYWKADQHAAAAMVFWEDTLKYVYLPRLKNKQVLEKAVRSGAASRDFFGIAYGQDGDAYQGFQFGTSSVQLDDTLLLIEPEAAQAYVDARTAAVAPLTNPGRVDGASTLPISVSSTTSPSSATAPPVKVVRSFHGTAEINASTAKMKMVELAEEVISVLCSDPNATVKVTVEIAADFPYGASEQIRRVVAENANSLYLKTSEWD
jgi:hypothetical protein